MPNYIVSESYFFREKNRRYEAGDTVEDLPVAYYEKYRISHPGLLRPAPLNTMGHPAAIRSEVAPAEPVADSPKTEPEVAAPVEVPAAVESVVEEPIMPSVPKSKGKDRSKK